MSDKTVDDVAPTGDTVLGEEEGFTTTNSKGNLNITENMEANEAFNMDVISEEINQTEATRSHVTTKNTDQNTNQELCEDTNAATENVTTESHETCGEGEAIGGSEETLCKPCQPCLENDKVIDSMLYCIECEEYLCEKCVEMHRGVKLSKKHKLVPKETPDEHGKELKINKKEECPIHLNEFIEWFCISDDKLCCPICKATEHSRCQSLVAIISVAKTTEIQTITQEITETQIKLKHAIDKKRTDITFLEEDRNDSLRVLEKIKIDTENTFERLSLSLNKENQKIEAKYTEQNEDLKTDIEHYSKIAANLDTTLAVLQKENICDEYKFIQMKKTEVHLKSVQNTISNDTCKPLSTPIGYERDKLYNEKLTAFERFGYFDDDKSLYSSSEPTKINVLQRLETSTLIFGVCVVGCEMILITDWTNRAIKLVDTCKGSIKSKLDVQSNPFGICNLEEGEMYAVTLTSRNLILLIEVGKDGHMITKTSFGTGEHCRGIAHCSSRLFVACGGQDNEGPGHIRIFDVNGKLQKTVMSDKSGYAVVTCPWKIEHMPGKNVMLITDTKILSYMDSSDNVIQLAKDIPVYPRWASLCFDPEGRVMIDDRVSKCIKLVSSDYRLVQTIVADLPELPVAIAFDSSNFKLFIAMENIDDLYCFQIERNNWDKPATFF
ncbi:uncharacterized protein LOC123531123 [Mercenaria mercenaria]|uniref:uncharacterized protein LOC123531123 n=1 Tax=Mercenaria mercenaria TaxID=6596 RepID=UPI00234FA79A|nr:uncharacterized protein LOC123531123 [Mercenaria mercenaria]